MLAQAFRHLEQMVEVSPAEVPAGVTWTIDSSGPNLADGRRSAIRNGPSKVKAMALRPLRSAARNRTGRSPAARGQECPPAADAHSDSAASPLGEAPRRPERRLHLLRRFADAEATQGISGEKSSFASSWAQWRRKSKIKPALHDAK